MMTKFVNKSQFVLFQAKKVKSQVERKKKSQQLDPRSIIYPWPQTKNAAQQHYKISKIQNQNLNEVKKKKKKKNRHLYECF